MKLIPIAEVIVPSNRFRRVFKIEDITDLAASILRVGLLQLPIIRGGNELVAGERRFRAIKSIYLDGKTIEHMGKPIPSGMFPFSSFEELSLDKARLIELQENIIRVDLTWQERALATDALHNFYTKTDPTWTIAKTAKEVNSIDPDAVAKRMALARNLHRPEVKVAKTERDAEKVLRSSLDKELNNKLRAIMPERKSVHTALLIDAADGFAQLPNDKFAVIVTDPPWGIGADSFHMQEVHGKGTAHTYIDTWESVAPLWQLLAVEGFRVAASKAHLYAFCAFERFHTIKATIAAAGWEVWPRPLIWSKGHGTIPKPDLGPSYSYEIILYANKGLRPTSRTFSDVIEFHIPPGTSVFRAAEKPVEVYSNLLERSIIAGDHVLDPFCGTGPIFPAAQKHFCIATGFDIDPEAISYAKGRT